MQYNRTVNISELLQDSALAKVMQKGIWLNELNQQFKRLFPSQFEGLYGIANIGQTTLSIEVANSAVRQGLLFKQQELLKLVQRQLPQVTQLKIYVNPEFSAKR